MTYRATFDIGPSTSIRQGIPTISSDDANSTVMVTVGEEQFWRGVRIDHKPEPGYTGTSQVTVMKQSDDSVVARSLTTGNIELYYPNHPLHGNSSLTLNQGSMDWDTHYYMRISNFTTSKKREIVAIRKIIL